MRKIVGLDDFKQADRFVERHERQDAWWVCDEYQIQEGEIVAQVAFPTLAISNDINEVTRGWTERRKHWRMYLPLEETPDLFLKIAYLYEQENFPEAALAFSSEYGVPGSSSLQWDVNAERTSLYSFRQESRRAWLILKLYEAVLDRDGHAAETLLRGHALEVLNTTVPFSADKDPDFQIYPDEPELDICFDALFLLRRAIEESVQALCRPTIVRQSYLEYDPLNEFDPLDVSDFKRGWKCGNLLGAAYLQAFWLITSGDNLSRCEYCRRIMSISQVHPNGRKRRTDKKFCNAACRQAHYRSKRARG